MAGLIGSENVDFPDVCRHYLGRWAEILSVIFSLFALLGGAVVYWVLMSNFLYHTVTFIHGLSPFNWKLYWQRFELCWCLFLMFVLYYNCCTVTVNFNVILIFWLKFAIDSEYYLRKHVNYLDCLMAVIF